jgi:probable F420-dependent oxidoreductase
MKIGLGLPHLGRAATPAAIRQVAIEAEAAGLDSLWAMDRLLAPVSPRSLAYPGRPDGSLPPAQQTVLDPLIALTVAADATRRIAVGTDVLVAPWYPPVLLARTLAAIDQVSAGRLVVGLGLGWSVDEFEAVGAPMAGRGSRLEEVIDVLEAVWADDLVAVTTTRESITPSVMGAKPVQRPRPPLLLAATVPAGLDRVARRADGWIPFGASFDDTVTGWRRINATAERMGRDPAELQLVVRADPDLGKHRFDSDRPPFSGSRRQVLGDIERVAEIGATELIFDFHATSTGTDELVDAALGLAAPAMELVA